jgi:sugar fermentation stimulation protein A
MDLYPGLPVVEAEFIQRKNRFVMQFQINGKPVMAHTSNSGRMEEFLIPGNRFFVVPSFQKYPYKVISTLYQDSIVFLDTIKINRIVAELLNRKLLPQFTQYDHIQREVSLERSKFDFLLSKKDTHLALEVKSCSLGHKGLVMFPDAPTSRGLRHLQDLESLAKQEHFRCSILYLTTHYGANAFMPNIHDDPSYSETFLSLRRVDKIVCKIRMKDPKTADLQSIEPIQILEKRASRTNQNSGAYLLVLHNTRERVLQVGRLGEIVFGAGYYVYTGSAKKNLTQRLARHARKRKKPHWHIDYIVPNVMKIVRKYPIRKREIPEIAMAERLLSISESDIPGFGSTDSPLPSHLTYFKNNPIQTHHFQQLILEYKMVDIPG